MSGKSTLKGYWMRNKKGLTTSQLHTQRFFPLHCGDIFINQFIYRLVYHWKSHLKGRTIFQLEIDKLAYISDNWLSAHKKFLYTWCTAGGVCVSTRRKSSIRRGGADACRHVPAATARDKWVLRRPSTARTNASCSLWWKNEDCYLMNGVQGHDCALSRMW